MKFSNFGIYKTHVTTQIKICQKILCELQALKILGLISIDFSA